MSFVVTEISSWSLGTSNWPSSSLNARSCAADRPAPPLSFGHVIEPNPLASFSWCHST